MFIRLVTSLEFWGLTFLLGLFDHEWTGVISIVVWQYGELFNLCMPDTDCYIKGNSSSYYIIRAMPGAPGRMSPARLSWVIMARNDSLLYTRQNR